LSITAGAAGGRGLRHRRFHPNFVDSAALLCTPAGMVFMGNFAAARPRPSSRQTQIRCVAGHERQRAMKMLENGDPGE
jgi:hypothetical protein